MWFPLSHAAVFVSLALAAGAADAQDTPLNVRAEIDRLVADMQARVVAWRRDFHQHPELGNREVRTADIVAKHLEALGFEVRTGVARTGVVGVLRGGRPGKVVALRADMDALPVTEQVDLPFASKVRTTWNGQDVGVMHACGHDNHVAVLMGVAEVLSKLRSQLPGTVKLIFQPAEEGAPEGEDGGAEEMVKEGVMENPKPDAVFGLHVFTGPFGTIGYRAGGFMAANDSLNITVRGSQTHGAMPWAGVDPIVVASQIVLGLQTIVSRQVNITAAPAIITVGRFQGGVRSNIIPDHAGIEGTIRTFDEGMKADIHRRIRQTAEHIAQASGATAEVTITRGYPVTVNDPALTERMLPTLERVAGVDKVTMIPPQTTSEDFSYYAQKAPSLFFFLYVTPPDQDPSKAAPNHSPLFVADERALPIGIRALANLAVDFLNGK